MHIIEMILLISALIIVHEAGHFFVARALGIRVDKVGFGLPIGPTLFEKKIGEITYCIHAFLLGGYVYFSKHAFNVSFEGFPLIEASSGAKFFKKLNFSSDVAFFNLELNWAFK